MLQRNENRFNSLVLKTKLHKAIQQTQVFLKIVNLHFPDLPTLINYFESIFLLFPTKHEHDLNLLSSFN